MSPPKQCLVCSNNSRNNPQMIFVQMPHPKKETRSRKAWFAVYADILDYNEQLDSHLCSDHFDLENDASNLDYYLTKRMKKLLFRPHVLPKPMPIINTELPPLLRNVSRIKEEPLDNYDNDEEEQDMPGTVTIKEEPLDFQENEIRNEPIDIKLEPPDQVAAPSPPPLLSAAQLAATHSQQQKQPLVINSFQVANAQLKSQLLRLAAQGRLRVVNVTNPEDSTTTPTLAVVGTDGIAVNTTSGVIQNPAPRIQGLPQLLQRPPQLIQAPQQSVQFSPNQGVQQRVRLVNVSTSQAANVNALLSQRMVNITPVSKPSKIIPQTSQPLSFTYSNSQPATSLPTITLQSPQNPSILRHQLIMPKSSLISALPPGTTITSSAPSLVPLPMRSVYACGKCNELFYTTSDRDRHITTKHPGSLLISSLTARENSVTTKRKVMKIVEATYCCEICKSTMPSAQKAAHLGTHETFKCVTCHQTLEKRIYAAHMMSHIEERPNDDYTSRQSKSTKKSSATFNKPNILLYHKKTSPKKYTSYSRELKDHSDISVVEVKGVINKSNCDYDPDVEKNLNEYMIEKDSVHHQEVLIVGDDDDNDDEGDHRGSDAKKYFYDCLICKKVFRSHSTLVQHRRLKHETEGQSKSTRTKCEYCHRSYTAARLRQHIHTKHTEKSFTCPKCFVKFISKIAFTKHMMAHKNSDSKSRSRSKGRKTKHVDIRVLEPDDGIVQVKEEVTTVNDNVEDDMDYDEDYPLSMYLQQSGGDTLQGNNVTVSVLTEDEVDEDDVQINDSPDYIDITQYNL